ncbi:hypothetical protein AGOR_G00190710 [Albula goreensis]|uniref:tRNA (adenine(37)-N6)-methyltransferase n=1 Tax=Albula goreensis TaxID=1534307 RepID=A0A8T3CSZ5_9TELE|nr:hypothetical protein AGOR_G00190710 [Albula goreensis]
MVGTCSCAQNLKELNQQISVMRKEIKNLRQLISTAVRTHQKHVASLQSVLSNSGQLGERQHMNPRQSERVGQNLSLEQGNIQTVPIGYISSCFPAKNGTPRQPTVCGQSRATLKIEQAVFNNPQHALIGLDHYSHVWVIFLFHKNGHLSFKAKVKPPRLNGQRVGVYSTRSPHRPNALGLTLARLERIEGDTLHLSGIDMITGTPVLDIKPYIPEYDSPSVRAGMGSTICPEMGGSIPVSHTEMEDPPSVSCMETVDSPTVSLPGSVVLEEKWSLDSKEQRPVLLEENSSLCVLSAGDHMGHAPQADTVVATLSEIKRYISESDVVAQRAGAEDGTALSDCSKAELCESQGVQAGARAELCFDEASLSQVASWIREPPISSLSVRFTPHAQRHLDCFQPPGKRVPGQPSFRFLRGPEEAAAAIRGVLCADPRSVYRRTRCPDRLFYFSLDSAHVTCWFGSDFAEVVQVRPAEPTAVEPTD